MCIVTVKHYAGKTTVSKDGAYFVFALLNRVVLAALMDRFVFVAF